MEERTAANGLCGVPSFKGGASEGAVQCGTLSVRFPTQHFRARLSYAAAARLDFPQISLRCLFNVGAPSPTRA